MKEPNNLLEKVKNIKCQNKNFQITSFDNFNSSNRIRFNILNVPIQIDCEQYINKISNSISVCEVFSDDNKSDIYGIFDIRDIIANKGLEKIIKNIDYNSFYYTTGDIYDILNNDKIEDDKAVELIKRCENIIKNMDYSTFIYCLNLDKEITTSELKARIGILICYYIEMVLKKKLFRQLAILRNIQYVIGKIEYVKEQLTNSQILRIFSYLLRARIVYNLETEILLLSREKNDSAYLLAQKFLLEEIDNITEFSKLFQGYLQMDSYVSHNYKINKKSYSLSIEPLFIVKYHLKSNYEGFFLLEEVNNDLLGWTEPHENVIIINEQNLFEKSNYIDPSHISDENDLKNCAFGISIVLRHENNSHKKKNLNNKIVESPLYYFEDGIAINLKDNNPKLTKGEDGIVIESLITKDQKIIISLAKDFIYGELLNYRLFIEKDFSELLDKITNIRSEKLKSNVDDNNLINNDNKIENIKKEMKDIYNYNQNDGDQLSREAKEAIKNRILKSGDIFYTLEDIIQIVLLAQYNGTTDQLSPIFKEIYKEINKSENDIYK